MSRLPPLIALSYFEVAARTKSFAKAAKELNVTPAAISHQVKALEEYLGVELFVRHHRRVSLTPAARASLPELHEGFHILTNAVDKIRLYSEERSVITICAEPLFATKWIVPRLHRFYSRVPEAEVRLQASLHSVDQLPGGGFGISNLKRAGIDLSVRLGHGDYEDLDIRRLMDLELVPMCKPGLVSASNPIELLNTGSLLFDRTLARFDDLCGWLKWFQQQGCDDLTSIKALQFGNGLLTLEAAVSGQGVMLGNRELLATELDAGKLEIVIDRPYRCTEAYYVVSAGLNIERPIVSEFRNWLVDEIEMMNS